MEASRFDTNQRFQTINPRYDGQIKFEWVQPLLRDMGDRISRHDIIIARNNRDASENDLKAGLIDTVYNVESLYWNLAYAIRNLEAKNQALQLAEDLLARNRKMVEQGLLAEIEILSAEAEVATRKADILGAQALVANTRDQLQTEMNLAAEENGGAWEVVPADEPQDVEKPVDLEAIWKAAVENRPDLLNAGINLQSKTLEFEVARNRLLPALNLNAQYWSPGLSGNQLIYLNNDPLTGVIVAVIPGGASAAMKDALDFKYQNWQLWLSLQLPLGAWISRGDYTAARMNRKSALLQRQDLEQKVRLELKTDARDVSSNFQSIQAYRTARELAAKKMTAEEKRLAVGLSTSYLVLQYQRDYAQALGDEIKALKDYNISLAKLDKAQGITLQAKHISFVDALNR